jgi:hypothetical protein
VYRSLRLISVHRPILLRFPISRYSMIIPGDPDAVFAVLQQLPVHRLRRRPPAFGHPPLATGSNAILTSPVLLESRTSGAEE